MILPLRAAYGLLNRLLFSGAFGDVSLRRALLIFLPKEPFNLIDIGACDGDFYEALSREKKSLRQSLWNLALPRARRWKNGFVEDPD